MLSGLSSRTVTPPPYLGDTHLTEKENDLAISQIPNTNTPQLTSSNNTPSSTTGSPAQHIATTIEPPRRFKWSTLWRPAHVNPLNDKSYTFPIFRFWDPYSTAFWLTTLGFFTAFLSWFAFAALIPEAVKDDLGLTRDQVVNSNLASLGGTAIVRLISGPACDRFGPRKVLAVLLVLGAVPTGFAALVTDIHGLECVRFFISILGGTFVPVQAYTNAFFDKTTVSTACAFAGGWGNLGGGATVAIMIGLYETYLKAGYSSHLAWRLCFPTVPVPCLILVAVVILLVGKDHPTGKWAARNLTCGSDIAVECDAARQSSAQHDTQHMKDCEKAPSNIHADENTSATESAHSETPSFAALLSVLSDPRIWMCAVCYLLTFGLETALDAALPGLLVQLFASDNFTSVDAAYAASTYGLLNIFGPPLGGIVSDRLYARFGIRGKVLWLLSAAICQGVTMIGLGFYVGSGRASLGGVVGFIVLVAVTGFAANGACYGVYGHFRPKNIGIAAGVVGAGGNIGGLFYTLIFKYQAGVSGGKNTLGNKFWISGVVNALAILPFFFVSLGDAV